MYKTKCFGLDLRPSENKHTKLKLACQTSSPHSMYFLILTAGSYARLG